MQWVANLQLSRYRLEQLRKHLCLPSSRSHSEHGSPHPELLRPPSVIRPVGLLGDMAAILTAARQRPPSLTDDTRPVLRSQPSLPQVGDLHQMDRLPFFLRALLASHPAAIFDTLLAKYRRSSTRQQQVPIVVASNHYHGLQR